MKDEVYTQSAAVEQEHWWYQGRGMIILYVLRRFVRPLPCSILDIGCGTGNDLVFLSILGEVTGIDDHPAAIAACRRAGFATVSQQNALHLQFSGNVFDVVCMLDVLNGIEDDRGAILEALRVTKPGGIFFATVAAGPGLWGRTDVLSQHYRRYTRRSLLHVLPSAGCRVLLCSHFNSFLFPLAWLVRQWERIIPPDPNSDIREMALPSRPINALLRRVFAFERHLLRVYSLPFGVSLMLVVQKK